MKNYKKIGLTFAMLSIIVIIVGVVFAIIINHKKTLEENIVIIKKRYTDFSVDIADNYRVRSELTEKLKQFNNDNYKDEHETYTTLLTQYNENMTLLNDSVNILEDKCTIEYEDNQTNIFCDNYQQLYEVINNTYIALLTDYNNKITSYNETSETDYQQAELINKEYIDFNKDGIYDGKNIK